MSLTVSLVDVCKNYQEGLSSRQVLQGVSLRAAAGETVALLGASGSGKSTLLNIISGLTPADSGEVEVAGRRLDSLSSEQRTRFRRAHVGFIFQFFHLIPTLTVAENLQLPLQLNDTEDDGRVSTLLERVGLKDRAESFPDRLSGGEQQRVAICRALAHKPAVILADEPTGNLDGKTAGAVLQLILEMARENLATLLLVTHSEDVAGRCGRTVRLDGGRLT